MADQVKYVEEQLPSANVNGLIGAVREMDSQVAQLSIEVVEVNGKVRSVTSEFEKFLQDFKNYVVQDMQDRRYQEALQDQVSIQQQLDTKFSHHQKVRRYVTGILQAADNRLVRKEVMETATAELMISIPHYWLVPALVALSAWINDNQELAERALREAMDRDDEKTSLLFALVCRRASRNSASMVWLRRYFAMQDPMESERKMIVVLDAYANGLFGADNRNLCAEQIGGWIAEIEDMVGFREAQVSRWETVIASKTPDTISSSYPYLKKYAKNWNELQAMLCNSSLHHILLEYVKGILEQPNGNTDNLKKQLDELLDSLVTNYDNEELPLREQKRISDLVVEYKGDEKKAMRKFQAERPAFEEKTDLMQLLTNAAMSPELIHASEATQKLSLAISKDWMIEAYDNVTLKGRRAFVQEAVIDIDGFECEVAGSSDEEKLRRDIHIYFETMRDDSIAKVKQSAMDYFFAGAGVVILFLSLFTSIPIVIGLLAAGFGLLKFYLGKKNVAKTINGIQQQYAGILEQADGIIRAVCAEMVDFSKEVEKLDGQYDQTMAYLKDIMAYQFIKPGKERNISVS